mmetsp:Transcript_10945/g.26963  ORF Transcript_10945/g.26963 Transcript_10945/m.26963 type:complete len:166 (-) Transcript_10945:111-608(-)
MVSFRLWGGTETLHFSIPFLSILPPLISAVWFRLVPPIVHRFSELSANIESDRIVEARCVHIPGRRNHSCGPTLHGCRIIPPSPPAHGGPIRRGDSGGRVIPIPTKRTDMAEERSPRHSEKSSPPLSGDDPDDMPDASSSSPTRRRTSCRCMCLVQLRRPDLHVV